MSAAVFEHAWKWLSERSTPPRCMTRCRDQSLSYDNLQLLKLWSWKAVIIEPH
jgi:hypothetical protein